MLCSSGCAGGLLSECANVLHAGTALETRADNAQNRTHAVRDPQSVLAHVHSTTTKKNEEEEARTNTPLRSQTQFGQSYASFSYAVAQTIGQNIN